MGKMEGERDTETMRQIVSRLESSLRSASSFFHRPIDGKIRVLNKVKDDISWIEDQLDDFPIIENDNREGGMCCGTPLHNGKCSVCCDRY
ncbi:MAG: hypothetical protein KJ556_20045 [Gammaproteobacteria bacterium]|nr:hypothetical protein [Gammaproteobacteria bacterium]